MPRHLPKITAGPAHDPDETVLPADVEERLERAEELLIEAFELLKNCMPPVLASMIATQIIEDLASPSRLN